MFYFTKDELTRLLAAADAHSPLHGLLLKTCYRHAFRISEALALIPANLKHGRLVVRRSKRGKITHQKASPELLAHIATVKPGELLFPLCNGHLTQPNRRTEPAMRPASAVRAANRLMQRLCRLAGIESHKGHTHALRHSLVHHGRAAGVTYPQLTAILGHADPKSIMHYDVATEQESELALAAVVGG